MRAGNRLNGRVLYTQRHRSFMVRMYLSMSPTCSSSDVSFNVTPSSAKSLRRGTNSLSPSSVVGLNPRYFISLIIGRIAVRRCFAVLLGMNPAMPYRILRTYIITNGIRLTYMMSQHIVSSWILSNRLAGSTVGVIRTLGTGARTVLPLSDPISGP